MKDRATTWPPTWDGPMFKQPGGRTRITLEKRKAQAEVDTAEEREKKKVRARDKGCRFPLCGCRRLKLSLEVSHSKHKGTNGRATKLELSTAPRMVQLCHHRHQHGAVSIHHHTLRATFLTRKRFDGPVAWHIDKNAAFGRWSTRARWFEVARESHVNTIEPLSAEQLAALKVLNAMEV